MSTFGRALGIVLLVAGTSLAQPVPPARPDVDPDVVSIRSDFELGKFADALRRAQERIDRGALPEDQTLELHRIAGLSAFNLGQPADAERHFAAILRLDPDFALDPFTVAPPAIQLFEKIRKDLGSTLDAIRYDKRLKAELDKQQAEAAARKNAEEEAQRRKLEAMATQSASRTIERRTFFVNFVPFGAGQFQQGRRAMGTALAVSEGIAAVISLTGYWAYNGLFTTRTITLDEREGSPTITERGIPRSKVDQAQVYRWLQLGGGAGFFTLYTFGVVDAIYRHEGEVTITTEPPKTSLQLLPLPGGAGASLSLRF